MLIYTETVIDYVHHLVGYKGICSNQHGHSGKIRIWVKDNELKPNKKFDYVFDSKTGNCIMFDFTNVKEIKELLDHKYLNEDVEYFKEVNPTAENLAIFIYNFLVNRCPVLQYKVRFYETAVGKNTYAEYGDF
jgi:6-pyruvoyltetrahydropterin/6-carboxytetrahydropterin synthase